MGPDPCSLVTTGEVSELTGGAPKEPPRTNGEGSPGDVGRLRICEWQISNGDKFLVSLIVGRDTAAAHLAVDRQSEDSKPLGGVGERGLVRVHEYPSGMSEIGVSALQDTYVPSLTHTSTRGGKSHAAVLDLLQKALPRLGSAGRGRGHRRLLPGRCSTACMPRLPHDGQRRPMRFPRDRAL